MSNDELKILIEHVDEKFQLVVEGMTMLRERMDRTDARNEERFDRLDRGFLEVKAEVAGLRKDLNDHRTNTELHTVKQRA